MQGDVTESQVSFTLLLLILQYLGKISDPPFPPLAPMATLSPGLKIPPFSVMV